MTILLLAGRVSFEKWQDIFKFSSSAAGGEFCEWVQFEIDVYIYPAS